MSDYRELAKRCEALRVAAAEASRADLFCDPLSHRKPEVRAEYLAAEKAYQAARIEAEAAVREAFRR